MCSCAESHRFWTFVSASLEDSLASAPPKEAVDGVKRCTRVQTCGKILVASASAAAAAAVAPAAADQTSVIAVTITTCKTKN